MLHCNNGPIKNNKFVNTSLKAPLLISKTYQLLIILNINQVKDLTFRVADSMVLKPLKVGAALLRVPLYTVARIQILVQLWIASTHDINLIQYCDTVTQILQRKVGSFFKFSTLIDTRVNFCLLQQLWLSKSSPCFTAKSYALRWQVFLPAE